jgi:branched-chain amino acid transport system substrate-binding protein
MNTKKYGIAILLIAIAVAGILFFRSGVSNDQAATVHIAANLPMTGDLATYGAAVRDGAVFGVELLEQSTNSGARLIFDWQDNAGNPTTAVTIMQRQYLRPPDIYVSGVKPQTMAIKDQIQSSGTPHFVWIFDAYINQNSQNNFRTWVSYKIEPPVYLAYVQERRAQRVAIVYVQLPHTVEEFEQIVVPGLKSDGKDVFVEPFDFGKKEFRDIAVKVRDFKPDLIILNGFQAELVGLVRALRPFGLIAEGNTLATYDMLDAANVLGPDELEGIRVVAPIFVTRPNRAEVARWTQLFRDRYQRDPLYTHAFAYDMVQIIHDTAKRLQLPASSDQWIAALRATNIEGVTGPLKFDDDGDLVTPLEIGVFRAGKLVPAAE